MTEEKENPDCPCIYNNCNRYGKCSECEEYHHKTGSKTACGK